MAETITVRFPDISGDATAYTAFLRNEAGTLLNSGGDAITETIGTSLWSFTLAETRVASDYYTVGIYSGTSETAAQLVFDGLLYPGQTLVDKDGDVLQTGDNFPYADKAVVLGTVGAGVSSTTTFTPSALNVSVSTTDQFKGKILTFDRATTTQGLRGQSTDITGNTSAALPVLTFTALTTTPVSGDTFRIT